MIDLNSQAEPCAQIPSQSPTSNGRLTRGVLAVSRSVRTAEDAIRTHPYFTAGVVAEIGLAIGGALVVRATRRRSFADRLMGWL